MLLGEYLTMYEREADYWWYVGLHELALEATDAEPGGLLLDAGCGTGRFLELHLARPGGAAVGTDVSLEALRMARRRSVAELTRASLVALPFADGAFRQVASFDVLCCLPLAEARRAGAELARVLGPGGRLVVQVPAHEALRSRHDEAVGTVHRFSRRELEALVEDAGLEVERCAWRMSFLFPLAAAWRLAGRLLATTGAPRSDLARLPWVVNRALTWVLRFENALLRRSVGLPFGLSLVCWARRPAVGPCARAGAGG